MNRMYRENVRSLNPFVGCLHDCIYCWPSFRRQMRRRKRVCKDCYSFRPHFHPERLRKPPPRTKEGEFIFYPSMGDPVFCRPEWLAEMFRYAEEYSDRTFLTQSKNPRRCFDGLEVPENVLLGTTIETDLSLIPFPEDGPLANYAMPYDRFSKAPLPSTRARNLDVVTVEPILEFSLEGLVALIKLCEPRIVYVGYDNHACRLPEPRLDKTLQLIDELKKDFEVRLKTIRKAWFEEDST